jgi:serine O-acetyltransferase
MFEHLKSDIESVKKRDPAARNTIEILLTYSGLHAVLMYRISHWFYKRKLFTVARMISQFARFWTGIEIHPGAKIGKGLFIDHGMGVVIGETAEIGDNCLIYQGVTLGGTGKDKGKRHPTLGNNVMVGAGARVLGPFKVGDNSKIAANAVVLEEVPPNCTAVGVPARIVKKNGKKIEKCCDLDQVHIPDPVSQELCKHLMRIERLEKQMFNMVNKYEISQLAKKYNTTKNSEQEDKA